MFDLAGKVALVTGASSGIGRSCGLALSAQGANVAVAARRIDKLEALVAEIKSHGHQALALQMDVTKKSEIDAAVAQTVKAFGRLDILVNNAGVVDFTPFLTMSETQWDRVLDTNLKGYFLVAQAAAQHMIKAKWGRIINIASIASGGAGVGMAGLVHYCASKGGIIAMTEALAIELGPYNILVNAIGPGAIQTEMNPKGDVSGYEQRLAIKRAGQPEEIASMVVYMASNESSYMTGSTVYVDGGWLAS